MSDDPRTPMMGAAVILTNGGLDHVDGKTAHGLIRGTRRFDIKAVIDFRHAGGDAGEVLDGVRRNIPIYADLDAYTAAHGEPPDFAIIGVALCGGKLDAEWQEIAMDALKRGISIVNGLHMHLSEIPRFSQAAAGSGARILDIRKSKPFEELHFWSGAIYGMNIPRIAVLGTDCAAGKRTTSQLMMAVCARRGIHAEMIYTGQTGWLQGSRYGFILDATLNDFVSGEIEAAIVQCGREAHPDLIIVEGQSSLRNPSGPCGSEMILSGNIKGVVLQHTPFRRCFDGTDAIGCLLPDIESEIKLIEMYGSRVIAVTLNGEGGSREDLTALGRKLEANIGVPAILPLDAAPGGMDRILPVLEDFMKRHDQLPDTVRRQPAGEAHA